MVKATCPRGVLLKLVDKSYCYKLTGSFKGWILSITPLKYACNLLVMMLMTVIMDVGSFGFFFLVQRLGKTSSMIRGLEHFTLVNLKQHIDIWKELLICSVKLNFHKNKKFGFPEILVYHLQHRSCNFCTANVHQILHGSLPEILTLQWIILTVAYCGKCNSMYTVDRQ